MKSLSTLVWFTKRTLVIGVHLVFPFESHFDVQVVFFLCLNSFRLKLV